MQQASFHDPDAATEAGYGRLAASVSDVDEDAVGLSVPDGRRWRVVRSDFPDDLAFVGAPVSLVHDLEGYVRNIESRPADPLPEAVRQRMEALLEWANGL